MFRQAVVFEALLLVHLESKVYNPVLFYDDIKIPDGNVDRYLTMMLVSMQINKPKEQVPNQEKIIISVETIVGVLVIKQNKNEVDIINAEAYINDIEAPDGKYYTTNKSQYKWIKVKKSMVKDFEMY